MLYGQGTTVISCLDTMVNSIMRRIIRIFFEYYVNIIVYEYTK